MTTAGPKSNQRKVALIGSTGGGTATLGHTNVSEFVRLIRDHLSRIGGETVSVTLDTVLFVSLDNGAGFDSVNMQADATLLFIQDGGAKEATFHDELDRINERVKNFEESTALGFQEGKLHGLISVSCKPSLFSRTLRAVAKRNVPVTGTGGSSLALATSEFKLRLIGNSGGSVGTTPETKAVSFASAFAKDWDLEYSPWKPKSSRVNPPAWRSVLNSSLPGFWSIALLKRFLLTSRVGELVSSGDREALLYIIESHSLPILCGVSMATSRRKVESVHMSAVLAASACYKTVLGGMISGSIVAFLEERLLYASILKWKVPATFTNLLTGGLVGIFTAAIMTPLSPYLSAATEHFRAITMTYLWESTESNGYEYIRLLISSFSGFLFCYGSKVGWYHSIFLPMILIEMELGDPSMLGTLDLLTLVLVCAGVCLGLIFTGDKEERSLAKRGITINLLCGDFIEACYPHMERYYLVNISGYVASSMSAAVLTDGCKSSAYLPFPIAIWLSDDRMTLIMASAIAFFIPFIGTVLNYILFIRNDKHHAGCKNE